MNTNNGLTENELTELSVLIVMTNLADSNIPFYWERRRELLSRATDEQKEIAIQAAYEN